MEIDKPSDLKLTRTLAEQVADIVLQMAMEGKFKPGEKLQEPEIAKMLGVSRVPVREALRILAADGIVTSAPYKGMRIMEVDSQKIIDIRQVRLQLERLAVNLCMAESNIVDTLIDELKHSITRMAEARSRGDLIQMTREDLGFHRLICMRSRNQLLLSFFDAIANQQKIIFSVIHRDSRYTTIYEDHMKIIKAFESRDEESVIDELSNHILTAAEYILGIKTK